MHVARTDSFNQTRLIALQNLSLIEGISPECIQLLAVRSRFLRCKTGEVIFDCGHSPDGVYLVLDGMVALATPDLEGRLHTVELFSPGHAFGDSGMIWGSHYGVSATVIRPSLLMKIPTDILLTAIQQDRLFALHFLGEHSRRIKGLLRRIGHFATDSSVARVASFLLDLPSEFHGTEERVTLPAAKQLIASILNMSCEAFSRALRKLMDEELIQVSKRQIRICARNALEGYAAPSETAAKDQS